MTVIELTEHGPVRSIRMADAAGRALAAARLVEAIPDPYTPGLWRVRAAGKVGIAQVTVPGESPITLRIVPKVPVARLLFLLGYSLDSRGWRDEDVPQAEEAELLPALARWFARQSENALRQGLLQGYRTTEENSMVVRGRIREADQIRRHHGRMIPLEIVHDEYTADIAENQLLRTACDRLCRLPCQGGRVPDQVRGALLRLRARLAGITPISRGHDLPRWRPTRLNTRYHTALRLAEIVLRGASVEHRPGDVTVSGFIVDMARVFEDFVTVALSEALTGDAGHTGRHHSHYLDERQVIRMIPDLTWYVDDGTPMAVVDAKYKAEKPQGFPDADLYQMLAYCTALDLAVGHLVYARGNAPHAAHRVRHAQITIHQHALDLDQPPAGLLAEVRALAAHLVR